MVTKETDYLWVLPKLTENRINNNDKWNEVSVNKNQIHQFSSNQSINVVLMYFVLMYFVLMFVDESWNDSLSVITDRCIENESVKGEGVIVYMWRVRVLLFMKEKEIYIHIILAKFSKTDPLKI